MTYPAHTCGPQLTDEVFFVCWQDKDHWGYHAVVMPSMFSQNLFVGLVDSRGRRIVFEESDLQEVKPALKNYMEYQNV